MRNIFYAEFRKNFWILKGGIKNAKFRALLNFWIKFEKICGIPQFFKDLNLLTFFIMKKIPQLFRKLHQKFISARNFTFLIPQKNSVFLYPRNIAEFRRKNSAFRLLGTATIKLIFLISEFTKKVIWL